MLQADLHKLYFFSLKRLHLLYDSDQESRPEKLITKSHSTPNSTDNTPRDNPNRHIGGLVSVTSDDTSTKGPSIRYARDPGKLFRYDNNNGDPVAEFRMYERR